MAIDVKISFISKFSFFFPGFSTTILSYALINFTHIAA